MLSKKRVHLQQFGIIRLSNPDLTYIRNPERNKIMFMPFHHLETYIRNLSSFLFLFSPSHLEGNVDGNHNPRAYMRVGRWVLSSFYFCQVGLSKCWRSIFLVLPKLYGCQVDLSNCCSCSYKFKSATNHSGFHCACEIEVFVRASFSFFKIRGYALVGAVRGHTRSTSILLEQV
jgi:hypothetical protein